MSVISVEPIRIVLVDDHAIVRRGLVSVLEFETDIKVVGEASNCVEALEVVAYTHPDIVLLDMKLSNAASDEGLRLCREILNSCLSSHVIILTAFLNYQLLLEAVKCGASGYVQKDVDTIELLKIVRSVYAGETGFDQEAMKLLVGSVCGGIGQSEIALTTREIEIVRLLARGFTNAEIAHQSFLSESTVKYHFRNISRKLGVHRRAEIIFAATKFGFL